MRTKHKRQSNRGRWVVPLFAVVFLTYFGYQAVNGSLGLDSRVQLEHKHAMLKVELAKLVRERKSLESRAALLKNGTIEKDMLDQQARALLEVTRPDDIVIYR